jgi:hypothetical protein
MPSWSIFDTLANPSYPGSSGYGINPQTGRYGPVYTPPPTTTRQDYAVYDAPTGTYISVLTGKPFTGKDPHTGQAFSLGKAAATTPGVQVPYSNQIINPNDPTQRYQPVDIVKSPDIAQAESDLMAEFKKSADASLKDFGSYLSNFKSDLDKARTAATAATDIGPTTAALTKQQQDYAASLKGDISQLTDVNAATAAAEQGIVKQAQDVLPQYDAAAKAVVDQQMAAVMGNLNRYKAGSSTPTSLGGDEEAILAAEAAKVYAPFEQAKIDRQLGLLTNLALPVQREIGARQAAAITAFNAPSQAAIFQSGQGTVQQIQQLKQAVAGMSYAQAVQFMQASGIPATIAQQILSGQITDVGALAAIEEQSRYRSLQDVLGVNLSQPVGYNMRLPGLPTYGPTTPQTPVPTSDTTPTAGPAAVPRGTPAPTTAPFGGAGGARYAVDANGNLVSTIENPTYGLPDYFGTRNPGGPIGGPSWSSSGGYPLFAGPGAADYNAMYGEPLPAY